MATTPPAPLWWLSYADANASRGIVIALVFLDLNGFTVEATEDELVNLGLGLADGRVRKAGVTVFFDEHVERLV